jgi:hypothetical protein
MEDEGCVIIDDEARRNGVYELGERYEISRIGTSPDQSDAQFKILSVRCLYHLRAQDFVGSELVGTQVLSSDWTLKNCADCSRVNERTTAFTPDENGGHPGSCDD